MEPEDQIPDEEDALTICTWCGEQLGLNYMPKRSASVFCSRKCEIEGNYWLYQSMLEIESTYPPHSTEDHHDGTQ